MSNPSRLNKLGLAGRKGEKNQLDSYITIIEVPIFAMPSSAEFDTGIPMPGSNSTLVSSVIDVEIAEFTGTVKTVTLGVIGVSSAALMGSSTVNNVGWSGVATFGPLNTTNNISFTLASADFVELKAKAILIFLAKG